MVRTMNRRAALGAIAVLPALAGDAFGDPARDPVLAAIERHKTAWRAFRAACDRTDEVKAESNGRGVTEADEAAYHAANEVEERAFEAPLDMPLQTAQGAVAQIEYLRQLDFDLISGASRRFLATLLRSPLITGAA